ncbi:MAG: homoserine dehydrogenase [Arenicellales bacterium]|nr:homoserine dehydrogenase [Arenicellales bacterium]
MSNDHGNTLGPVKIGILGLGTVGGGTVNVLQRNADEIARRAGRRIDIGIACARDLTRKRSCDTEGIQLVADPFVLVEDPQIQVVVELIGGESPAKDLVLKAIHHHKHVVTANKALIAVHGNEIFDAAQRHGVMVAFEAAVAGGISIIKAIREGLAGNRIESLAGIINGTGNYILTRMRDQGSAFGQALAEAQSLGYAEEDPTFDVEGIDAAHKLTILAAIAYGIPLQFDKVYTEGISAITVEDIKHAQELGYAVKHLGIAKRSDTGIELRVHPTLIPQRQIIASVDGVMNAVLVNGDAVGPTLHYGAGAGADPTASSIVADIVDVVRALTTDPTNRVPHLAFQADAISNIPVVQPDEFETAYFLSMEAIDRPGVLADVTRIFGQLQISIEAILQKEPINEETANVIILTQRTQEKYMNEAVTKLQQLEAILGPVKRIRVEHLNHLAT